MPLGPAPTTWVDWIPRRSTATRSVRSTPCWDSPPSTAWGPRASGIVRDHDLRRVVAVATGAAAPFAGLPEGRLEVGARADLVLVDAENAMDALVRTPPREVVIAGGRLLVG